MVGRRPDNMLHKAGRALLIAGVLLLSFFFGAYMHRFIMVKVEMARFNDVRKEIVNKTAATQTGEQGIAPTGKVQAGIEQKSNDSWPPQMPPGIAH